MPNQLLPSRGRWRAIEELGKGGQGKVYLAARNDLAGQWEKAFHESLRDLTSRTIFVDKVQSQIDTLFASIRSRLDGSWTQLGALKILHLEDGQDEAAQKARKRIYAELEALRSIEHPNLINLLDCDSDSNWIVYEYFKNGPLENHQDRFKGDPEEAIEAMIPLVRAVKQLHADRRVHRDIKPGNIFVGDDGRLVLGDLGLVFSEDNAGPRVTSTNEKVGTTNWMPTWCIGDFRWEDVKPSFDVFALAKLLWSLIAGDWTLQLHYYSRDKYDLCKRFPDDPSMQKVNESLAKCLVEFETSCLPSAAELLVELQSLRNTLNQEVNKVDRAASKTGGRSIARSANPKKKGKVQTLDISAGATGTAFDDQVHIVFYKSLWGAEKYYEAHVAIDVGHLPRKEEQCAIPGSKLLSGNFEFRFLDVLEDRIRVTVRQIN